MSGWFSKKALGTQEPAAGSLRVQTSMVGVAKPVVYGRNRVPGNLLAYYDLQSVPHEQRSEAGKGGGSGGSTSYTYTATVLMALGEGAITGVRTVWIGKEAYRELASASKLVSAPPEEYTVPASSPYTITLSQGAATSTIQQVAQISTDWAEIAPGSIRNLFAPTDYTLSGGVLTFAATFAGARVRIEYSYAVTSDAASALGRVGLTLKTGALGQSVWSYLSSAYPAQAIGYSGLAYVYAQGYALDNSAQVPNHSFELDAKYQWSSSWPDASPADVVRDILSNPLYGVGFPDAHVDWSTTYTLFRTYCAATAFFVSPVYAQQRAARDAIGELIEAANADPCWLGDKLAIIPRGDKALTNFGQSYTPNTTPVAALTPDDIFGMEPIQVERPDVADLPNRMSAEISSRDRDYNTEIVTVEDDAAIAQYGLRQSDTLSWGFVCKADIANMALRTRIQRLQSASATYRFPLPWRFLQVQIGDLLTLTDDRHPLSAVMVKVREMTEAADDVYEIVAEDFPVGHANAPLIAPQVGSGFKPEYNADPGSITAPMFVEPPGGWTGNGLEVWAAASGDSANWGGCDVFVSMDGGTSYKLMGRIDQPCRYGALTADLTAGQNTSLQVQLIGRGGELRSVDGNALDAGATLCFVGDTGTGEWLSYRTATLTAANRYTLTQLVRGRFGSSDGARASTTRFLFADGAVAESGPLPESMIGRTLFFKFCSYNIFGASLQSLADVPAYSYTVSGRFRNEGAQVFGNEFPNPSLTLGPSGLSLSRPDGTPATGAYWHPLYTSSTIIGTPSNVVAWCEPGTEDTAIRHDAPKACRPGQRIQAHARLLCLNVGARVQVVFYSPSGAEVGKIDGDIVQPLFAAGSPLWVSNGVAPNDRQWYRPSYVVATAPANTASARMRVIASRVGQSPGWNSAFGAWVSLTEPFIGFADAEQTRPSTWQPGPVAASYAYYESTDGSFVTVIPAVPCIADLRYRMEATLTAGTYLDAVVLESSNQIAPLRSYTLRRAVTRASGTVSGSAEAVAPVRLTPGVRYVFLLVPETDAGAGATVTARRLSVALNIA